MIRLSRRAALLSLLATSLALPRSRSVLATGSREGLLLLDASLGLADLRGTAATSSGRRTLAIQSDLVRQWYDGLGRELRRQGRPVTALVRWDKALVLGGLAREAGIRIASTRLSRSLFRIDLFV